MTTSAIEALLQRVTFEAGSKIAQQSRTVQMQVTYASGLESNAAARVIHNVSEQPCCLHHGEVIFAGEIEAFLCQLAGDVVVQAAVFHL